MNKRRRRIAKAHRKMEPIYVNAYEVDRLYGGPEEGGWYFDAGEPLESIRVYSGAKAEEVRERLLSKFASQQSAHNRYSVIGGPDVEVYIESEKGKAFPERYPHYE